MRNQRTLNLSIVLMILGVVSGCTTHRVLVPHTPSIAVVLREFKFDPSPIKVAAGKVRFLLTNRGSVEHDFLIAEAMRHDHMRHENHLVRPGQTRVVEVDLKPGVYEAICTVPGHKEAGMRVTVEAGPPTED